MIILLKDRFREFADTFWAYIREGGYRCGWKNNEDAHYYRFTDPKPGYPIQLELFSRRPDCHLEGGHGIVPIHISDDVSSLSAILLQDDFYEFMLKGRKTVGGVSVLAAEYITPFKCMPGLTLRKRLLKAPM